MADLGSMMGMAGLGGGVGAAIVQLRLDAGQYNSELAAQQGKTTAAANSMGNSFTKFGGVAKAAGMAAAAGIALFVVTSVKAAMEAERVMAQLRAAVGGATGAYEEQATALSYVTGYQDELILSADIVLSRFKMTEAQILDTIPVVLDYARATGTEVPSAAEVVGKALLGNTRALKTVGIEFTATGNRAADLETIMGLLKDKVGGSAEAFGQTLGGELAIAQARFDDLQEEVGAKLIPILTDLTATLSDMIPVLQQIIDLLLLIPSVSPGILQVAGELGKLKESADESGSSLWEMIKSVVPGGEALAATGSAAADTATETDRLTAAARAYQEAANAEALAAKEVTESLRDQIDAILSLNDATFGVISAVRSNEEAQRDLAAANRVVARLQEQGKEGTKAYAEALRDQRAAALNAIESQNDMVGAVRGLQEEIRDGKTTMAAAIADLKAMGREANLSKGDIRTLIQELKAGVKAAREFGASGLAAGKAFGSGIVNGITYYSEAIYQAAYEAANKAELGARAALQAESPSRVAERIGRDFVEGFAKGISGTGTSTGAGGPLSEAAAEAMVERWITRLEEKLGEAQDRLAKALAKATSFRDAIAGGFSAFLDIGGAFTQMVTMTAQEHLDYVLKTFGSVSEEYRDALKAMVSNPLETFQVELAPTPGSIQAYFTQQLADAKQFASVLEALQRQGASPALLQQIAAAGPQALPFAQALLQMGPAGIAEISATYGTIANLAGTTAAGLSEAYFGTKIDELRDEVRGLRHDIRDLMGDGKNGKGVTEAEIVDALHGALIRKERRSGSLQFR